MRILLGATDRLYDSGMADPLSLAVLTMTTSLAGLVMRGAAVAIDPSRSSAASLPGETLNA